MVSTGVGIDGATDGWIAVKMEITGDSWVPAIEFSPSIENLYRSWGPAADLILIDIPIGLPSKEPGRECDYQARRLLGRPRGSSVFPPPARCAFEARGRGADYSESSGENVRCVGKRISKQAWNIMGKISEVDALLRSGSRPTAGHNFREAHPELLFWALNDTTPCRHNKRRSEGRAERLDILERHCSGIREWLQQTIAERRNLTTDGKPPAPDDILDAAVCALVAACYRSNMTSLPAEPPRDVCGLPMEIVYPVL